MKAIGKDIGQNDTQLNYAKGYDHTFVFDKVDEQTLAATVVEPITGRLLELYTNEPGVQLYTGNWVSGCGIGKYGKIYGDQESFCLETQHYPDSPNKPHFPSTLVKPGETYHSLCVYKVGVVEK